MTSKKDSEQLTFRAADKLPYTSPKLVVYGDLRAITQNSNMTGADGGNGNNSKSM